MNEVWKDIDYMKGFEGLYQVSNLGNVKSLSKIKFNGRYYYNANEKILSPLGKNLDYYLVRLYKDKKGKSRTIHSLVAEAFLNHTANGHKIVIDHINDIKKDNRLENLQIVTQRENCKKTQGRYSSKYKGVSWGKTKNKWLAHVRINGKLFALGSFKTELDASIAYQNKLLTLNN